MMKMVSLLPFFILVFTGWKVTEGILEHNESLESQKAQIPDLKGKIKREEKKKKQLIRALSDIEETKRKIEKVALENEKLQRQFPIEISDTENLELIRNVAQKLNIKDISLSPGEEENKGFYFTKLYTLKGTGTFLQFLIFLEKIGETSRLLNINNLTLDRTKTKQKGRFQLVNANIGIEVYRYNPKFREDRGFEKIEQEFKKKRIRPRPRKKKKKQG